jgi:hypothetical protein
MAPSRNPLDDVKNGGRLNWPITAISACQTFFRRVAQFSDENERPLFSVLPHLRPAGGIRRVPLAISLLLVFLFISVD